MDHDRGRCYNHCVNLGANIYFFEQTRSYLGKKDYNTCISVPKLQFLFKVENYVKIKVG
jgi:hypothetical protein